MVGSYRVRSLVGALTLLLALPASIAHASAGWLPLETFSTTLSQTSAPAVAMTQDGTTVVAWPDLISGQLVVRTSVREPGKAFVSTTVASGGLDLADLSVAISSTHTAAVAWSQKDAAGNWTVNATVRLAGETWRRPEVLSSPTGTPPGTEIAVGDDEALVIWKGPVGIRDVIMSRTWRASTGWGSIDRLSPTDRFADHQQLAMDANGNATAIWISLAEETDPLGEVQVARRSAGAAWSSATAPSGLGDRCQLAERRGRTAGTVRGRVETLRSQRDEGRGP